MSKRVSKEFKKVKGSYDMDDINSKKVKRQIKRRVKNRDSKLTQLGFDSYEDLYEESELSKYF